MMDGNFIPIILHMYSEKFICSPPWIVKRLGWIHASLGRRELYPMTHSHVNHMSWISWITKFVMLCKFTVTVIYRTSASPNVMSEIPECWSRYKLVSRRACPGAIKPILAWDIWSSCNLCHTDNSHKFHILIQIAVPWLRQRLECTKSL